jgi:hypothetical protein
VRPGRSRHIERAAQMDVDERIVILAGRLIEAQKSLIARVVD